MKILILSAGYPPVPGGVADYTFHLAHGIGRLGHRVRVLTSMQAGQPSAPPGRVDEVPVEVAPDVATWQLTSLPRLLRVARHFSPDMVVLQYVPYMYGRGGIAPAIAVLPLLLRRMLHTTVVATMHELARHWVADPTQVALGVVQRAQSALLARTCDWLVATNPRYARVLRAFGARAGAVREIPVGANILPVPLTDAERAVTRAGLGGRDRPLLGAFSPLNVGAQPEHLLTVLRRHGSARLVLLGGLASDLRRREQVARLARRDNLAARLFWTAYLPPVALSHTLASLDVYVHTGGLGASARSTTLAAALAHGLPVVAYRGPETSGLFLHGENIWLARRGDPDALAEGVSQLLGSPALSTRLAQGARALYLQHFTWESIARRYLDLAPAAVPDRSAA